MYVATIYYVEGCRFCDDARSALNSINSMGGIRVVEINATRRIRESLANTTGCPTLPSVWVDGVYIGGYSTGPAPFGGLARVMAKDLWHLARG